jgi:chromosome segregation ATPase
LQRDLNRIKKDSENLHKQENTLEMKLSRSANETEEHKNKRLAAKHELMSVLRTLDAERDSTTRLCQRVKFTVAPRILQQHQILHESSGELEGALNRLYLRFGKTLPTTTESDSADGTGEYLRQNGSHNAAVAMQVDGIPNTELMSVIEKLDDESKRVSHIAASLSDQVEKLRGLLDSSSGDRTCFSVFSELIATGSLGTSPATLQNHANTLARVLPAIRGGTQGYGQVPGASETS